MGSLSTWEGPGSPWIRSTHAPDFGKFQPFLLFLTTFRQFWTPSSHPHHNRSLLLPRKGPVGSLGRSSTSSWIVYHFMLPARYINIFWLRCLTILFLTIHGEGRPLLNVTISYIASNLLPFLVYYHLRDGEFWITSLLLCQSFCQNLYKEVEYATCVTVKRLVLSLCLLELQHVIVTDYEKSCVYISSFVKIIKKLLGFFFFFFFCIG